MSLSSCSGVMSPTWPKQMLQALCICPGSRNGTGSVCFFLVQSYLHGIDRSSGITREQASREQMMILCCARKHGEQRPASI